MRIIDAFFYLTFILLQKFGRDESDAKWSAMLHTSFILCIFILIICALIGNSFRELDGLKHLVKNYIFVVGIFSPLLPLCYYRFYKTHAMCLVEKYFLSLSYSQYKTRKILYIIFNILIFVMLVITAKLNK